MQRDLDAQLVEHNDSTLYLKKSEKIGIITRERNTCKVKKYFIVGREFNYVFMYDRQVNKKKQVIIQLQGNYSSISPGTVSNCKM